MNWIVHSLDIVWGVLCVIGWIVGVAAWVRRGFGTPLAVLVTAFILFLIGLAATFIALHMGISSLGFTAFAVIGFPVWSYVGWFFLGCPPKDEKKKEEYDISQALSQNKK